MKAVKISRARRVESQRSTQTSIMRVIKDVGEGEGCEE